ncbi:MAG: hypothetical protein OXT70_05130 [Chloroflexota bacterium]|nr:hypothetical protein [Chloroflexota bacterium]
MTDTATTATFDATVRTEIRLPALRLRRGGRTLYQLALKADHFGQIAPTVPARIIQSAQRGFTETHARKIAQFMLKFPDTWAFGPVSLALESKYMTFEPFDGLRGQEYGTLTLAPAATEAMRILDGQHRRAALQYIRQRELGRVSDSAYEAAQRGIDNSDLSVDLYEIDELSDVRRVFNWMNTTKNVTASERVLLDDTDPFNAAVQRITGSLAHRFEGDKIAWLSKLTIPLMDNEFRRVPSRVNANSSFWLSATNVRSILMARTAARQRVTKADRKRITPAQVVADAKKLFNDELPQLRKEWAMLKTGGVDGLQLPTYRDTTMAFDVMMPLAAAWSLNLLHNLPDGADHFDDLAAHWRGLDLSVDNPSLLLVLDERDTPQRVSMRAHHTKQSAQNILDAAQSAAQAV